MTKIHIPRKYGSGARQVIAPAKPRMPRRRWVNRVPRLCGAPHPSLDLTCGAEVKYRDGKPVRHRGQHRARPLVGVVYRWPATKAAK